MKANEERKVKELEHKIQVLEKNLQKIVEVRAEEIKLPQNSEKQLNQIQEGAIKFNLNKKQSTLEGNTTFLSLRQKKALVIAATFGALCGGISPTNTFLKLIIGTFAGSTAYCFFSFFNKDNSHSSQNIDKSNQTTPLKKF